jgi:hypothetical protein
MTERKIIKLGKNNYNMNEIKNMLSSSKKINKLIKEKKQSLKSTNYLNNYDFKKTDSQSKTKKTPILKSQPQSILQEKQPILQEKQPIPKHQPTTFKPKSIIKKNKKLLSKGKKLQFKTKSVNNYFKPKQKKTKKYNKYEIKYIIHSLKKLVDENNYKKINQLLKKLRREQLIQLLSHYKVIKYDTRAPTPLLKNLIFNFILGNIHIEKK